MNNKYVAQAQTQEEAIEKGLNALGITLDEAIVKVVEPGKKGFLGIGQKDAVVTIERKVKTNVVDEFLATELDLDRKKETPKPKKAVQKEVPLEDAAYAEVSDTDPVKEKALAEESEMTKQEKIQGRDHTEVELVGEKKQVQSEVENTDYAEDTDVEVEEDDDDTFDASKAAELTEEEIAEKDQAAVEEVRQYLKEVIFVMGIEDVEVYTSRVKNNVKYDIETENAGLVIGRHGKVLNGLQTLAQNHIHQLAYSKINVRADAEKYRERRQSTVENLANRTAERVIKTNKQVKLDPMPAHERKQIHRYLNQNPKVKTHSEGREPKRYLVVEPNDLTEEE